MPQNNGSQPARIDPRSVLSQRRKLQLSSFEDILAEAERLTELVQGGNTVRADLAPGDARLVHLGNMPLGQMLGHLGLTLRLAVHPAAYRFPFPMRLMFGMLRRRFLTGGLSMPVEAPARLNSEILPDAGLRSGAGLEILQQQIADFLAADSLQPNLMLGRLSRGEWEALSCRHAEWHLGFIIER
ncbi:DUF1569 domain-containing protein [bacterium]|nr:DUF1569 domain-containing protein [bacterium]